MTGSRRYDKLAPFYNIGKAGDRFYRKARQLAIEQLNLTSGASVLDIFCGTGIDLPLLAAQVGDTGSILAVDGSAGMLEQAQDCAESHAIATPIEFLQADFSQPDGLKKFEEAIRQQQAKHVFFSLGLTCLANWRELCSLVIDASPSGTRFSIIDIRSDRLTLSARFVNWIGVADCRRPVWQVLEERCESFTRQDIRPVKLIGLSVVVASGVKP